MRTFSFCCSCVFSGLLIADCLVIGCLYLVGIGVGRVLVTRMEFMDDGVVESGSTVGTRGGYVEYFVALSRILLCLSLSNSFIGPSS